MKKSYKLLSYLLLSGLLNLASEDVFSQVKRTQVWSVSTGTDDAEEAVPGGTGTVGAMDLTSSDLEIMLDGTKQQLIGLRFTGITIPQGAVISRAYIQFANKGDKAPIAGDAYITAQNADNGSTFTNTAFNITSRTQVADSVLWPGSTSSTWGTAAAGIAGAEQRTPDIKSVIQRVIDRAGWAAGNALVVMLKGAGVRNTYSFDGSGGDNNFIPKLIIEYAAASMPAMSVTNFPVAAQSEWKYLDNGTNPATAWIAPSYDDASWSYGAGKLGYNDNAVTTLNFGSNAASKYITYYFRKKFNIVNTAILTDSLNLTILRDDGAIVYINGIEVVRSNMPAGAVYFQTFSSTIVDGADETTYFSYHIPKGVLINGANTIAVEVHQRDGTSSDLGFDLTLSEYSSPAAPVACNTLPATHISNFTSVLPSAQPDSLRIPSTHTFQMILQSGDPYTNPVNGVTKSTFDFTGYVPINGSSNNGYLSINHEEGSWPAAGVSMLSINFNPGSKIWNITNNVPVDFDVVAGTGRNCSGTVTPWGTIITSEEILPTSDANNDGFQDIGWNVEIDPATHAVMDHNKDGIADKLWR
ncbi:MAG TPA: alkaline phosphatase PhoX, partial [Segetibacter sp.]